MSKRKCVVCESSEATDFCLLEGHQYVMCTQCGLVFLDDVSHTKEMYVAYSGGWFKSWRRRITGPFRNFYKSKNYSSSKERSNHIFKYIDEYVQKSDVKQYLDIGCNKGFLLVEGIDRGWNVYGAELIEEVTYPFQNAFKKFKNNILTGKFEDVYPKIKDKQFELITAIDVIEHFEDPATDIRNIFSLLKPGGIFIIQTPDTECPKMANDKCGWLALKPDEHLHLFKSDNLKILAEKTGFSEYKAFDAFEEADGNFCALMRK